jgi:cytochrome c-type biogenesis protein CcmH/NrfG
MDASTGTAVRSKSSRINRETAVCATCHSRRGILKTGVESDGSFLDHYRPALLTQNLYHADGQIQEEVYVWGSFMQSKMQSAGVTCSDCHQPHSLELRAPQEQVCSRCHSPAKFANTTHHHHAPDSKGANCLDCHMPETTYMVVDPRRDHSLRVPRPDISLNFSTPNACNQCHLDKDTEWAAEKFEQMWPQVAQPFQNWTQAFALARSGAPQSEIALMRVIKDPNTPDIARATAVTELRAFLSPLSGQLLHSTLSDESALVRMASLGALEALPPANRYTFAAPLLEDPVLAVRIEAARISASSLRSETDEGQRKILQSALKEYFDAHILNADRSDANLNLGNLHVQTGDIVEAEKAYRRAIKLDSKFGPAYVNLADMYRSQGMDQYSGKVLKQGIDESPRDASLHHALGLLEARGQNLELALASLKTATQLAPENARYIYVYGVALNSTGKSGDALEALGTGHGLHPQDREIIFMIASIYRDQRQYQLAREWAQKLTDINPADQNALQLIEAIDAASRMNE